jgi:hypothetical protein
MMAADYQRAPGGWLIVPRGEKSPCPHHRGLCAYSGTEPDRCPACHSAWSLIDAGDGPGDRNERVAVRAVASGEDFRAWHLDVWHESGRRRKGTRGGA